jgi:NhaP-type Na+/H+ or K+/H+ antiporter
LKTHIGGESLLNDGSAIVFFSIFSQRFYAELGVDGFGSDIDFVDGVALFCQKAIGGAFVGLFFGIGMLAVLILLHRRFNKEENITQVMAVLAIAYLNYYVADFVWKTSGVVATLVAGLFVRYLGRGAINDVHLLDNFFALLEHMLNTVLFSLGGLVFGYVIIENHVKGFWGARDWGYLILLYVLLTVIRTFLFVVIYPITVRIGLKTNWQETLFQIHGGLRGAVGIALAITLDNTISEATGGSDDTIFEEQTSQVYQMVGGVAFLTLLINGTTAGPLLRKLGLADSTETRKKITEAYKVHFRAQQIDSFIQLLTNDRFKEVDFGFVKKHVPYLSDLTLSQISAAVEKLKETTPHDVYKPPHLHLLLTYFLGPDGQLPKMDECSEALFQETPQENERQRKVLTQNRKASTMKFLMAGEPLSTFDLRLLFISMVRAQYENQVTHGELESQHLVTVALEESLEEAEVEANKGKPLNDYESLREFYSNSQNFVGSRFVRSFKNALPMNKWMKLKQKVDSFLVEQAIAYTFAHEGAQAFFQEQFGDVGGELSEAGKVVLEESRLQVSMAKEDLEKKLDKQVVELAVSIKFCKILLNKAMRQIDKLVKYGLLKDSEAGEMVDEVKELLDGVILCEDCEGEVLNRRVEASDDKPKEEQGLRAVDKPLTMTKDNDDKGSQNSQEIEA